MKALRPGQVWKDADGTRWIVFDARREFDDGAGCRTREYLIRSSSEVTYRVSTDVHGWVRVG